MARCETCGAELQDAGERFCGGDRCLQVFIRYGFSGLAHPGLAPRRPADP
jgi:hypothetical protein